MEEAAAKIKSRIAVARRVNEEDRRRFFGASLHLHTQRSPRYNNKMPVNTCFAVHYGPTFDSRASLLHRFRQHPTATVIANYLHASTRFFSSISLHQNSDHFQIYFPFKHSSRFNFENEQRSRGHGYRFKCT